MKIVATLPATLYIELQFLLHEELKMHVLQRLLPNFLFRIHMMCPTLLGESHLKYWENPT